MKKLFIFQLLLLLTLSACTSIPDNSQAISDNNLVSQRIEKLAQVEHWQVTGKIAFLQQQKRESATLYWQVDEREKNQTLKLTTYLGINVLSLAQTNSEVSLTVDGKDYYGENIDELIWQLTGLIIPTKAMHSWMKGLPYSSQDTIEFDAKGLPKSLTSFYNNGNWQVDYQAFRQYQQMILPSKLTVSHGDLTIKLAISQWSML